ncbi:hypothetical protein J21TS7_01410 [Paenibacillus cineris]|uniref:Uncharacterized protein n=1 Tax=Paenibacillus cineris TaxID=237530 RepID=A0ABQ4L796_9BACL|nr:hypothetical protein J21TS7_01410 [Paenibacillus cineris]GIO63463.1 hypothetical protein J43TS9_50370 [Paenibacillus cineris]
MSGAGWDGFGGRAMKSVKFLEKCFKEDLKSVPKLSIIKVVVSTERCRVLTRIVNQTLTAAQHTK